MTSLTPKRRVAWLGFMLPPAAFLAILMVNYAAVSPTCLGRAGPAIPVATGVGLLLAWGGMHISYRVWREAGRQWPRDEPGWMGEAPFLGVIGLLLGVVVSLVLLVDMIAFLILNPCQ